MYECANDTTIKYRVVGNIRIHCVLSTFFFFVFPLSKRRLKVKGLTIRQQSSNSSSQKKRGLGGRRGGGGGCGWKSNVKVTDVQAIRDQRLLLSFFYRSMENQPALMAAELLLWQESCARVQGNSGETSERQSEFSLLVDRGEGGGSNTLMIH